MNSFCILVTLLLYPVGFDISLSSITIGIVAIIYYHQQLVTLDRKKPYFDFSQLGPRRFTSYWHQLKTLLQLEPKTVLEIGIGANLLAGMLERFGPKVTTVDNDPDLKPNHIADITNLPFSENSFDIACTFEVLEHIPFDQVLTALKELSRVASDYVVFSVPDAGDYFFLHFPFTPLPMPLINFKINLPKLFPQKHQYDGKHYWELNKQGYSLNELKKYLKQTDLQLVKHFRAREFPYHHFFVLKVR